MRRTDFSSAFFVKQFPTYVDKWRMVPSAEIKRRKAATLIISTVLAGMIGLFNNCSGPIGEGQTKQSSTQCTQPCAELLFVELAVPTPYRVAFGTQRIDFGGRCNHAGYPSHEIQWSLVDVQTNARVTGVTTCNSGRYFLSVNAGAAISSPKDLYLKIVGIESTVPTPKIVENNFNGVASIRIENL